MKRHFKQKKRMQRLIKFQKWNRQIHFYHNKGTGHFFLGVSSRGDYHKGHDMTTHPSLYKNGMYKRKYYLLVCNPEPGNDSKSDIHKKIRIVKAHFNDTGKKRLETKKGWKLNKTDKKAISKLDKNK